jgi:hypothetical protein
VITGGYNSALRPHFIEEKEVDNKKKMMIRCGRVKGKAGTAG